MKSVYSGSTPDTPAFIYVLNLKIMNKEKYILSVNLEFPLESNDPINIANAFLELKAMLGESTSTWEVTRSSVGKDWRNKINLTEL